MQEKTSHYKTTQKETFLSFFKEQANSCFSSKQVVLSMENQMGPATVYRYLSRFTKEGILTRFIGDADGRVYYKLSESSESPQHVHLQCVSCSKLIHTDCSYFIELEDHIKESHSFNMDLTKTVFFGLCEDCNSKGEEK